MKIILQKRGNSLYLKRNGEWTNDYRDAVAFRDTDDALAHCVINKLPNMQVVLKFENSLYDLSLPLQDRILPMPSESARAAAAPDSLEPATT
jgi:hypothetical protein